jgi:SanA protein
MKTKVRRSKVKLIILFILIFLILSGIFTLMFINSYIDSISSPFITDDPDDLSEMKAALVPGALVYSNGVLSHILEDRVLMALELYELGKVEKFILSGDHGRVEYDEVNSMKDFLIDKGVPSEDIFLDHAGFSTYDSVYRAKAIFQAENIIIVTQEYHLPRAVYIARSLGINAYGYKADRRTYREIDDYIKRERLANIKAFFDVLFKIKPKYLGDPVPITGDSSLSWD